MLLKKQTPYSHKHSNCFDNARLVKFYYRLNIRLSVSRPFKKAERSVFVFQCILPCQSWHLQYQQCNSTSKCQRCWCVMLVVAKVDFMWRCKKLDTVFALIGLKSFLMPRSKRLFLKIFSRLQNAQKSSSIRNAKQLKLQKKDITTSWLAKRGNHPAAFHLPHTLHNTFSE